MEMTASIFRETTSLDIVLKLIKGGSFMFVFFFQPEGQKRRSLGKKTIKLDYTF